MSYETQMIDLLDKKAKVFENMIESHRQKLEMQQEQIRLLLEICTELNERVERLENK